jgi:hypothetical protein
MSDDIDLEIPDFLRRTPGAAQEKWTIKTVKEAPEARHPWHLPKHMDAACWALVRERDVARERKKQEGLAALKQWKLEHKR